MMKMWRNRLVYYPNANRSRVYATVVQMPYINLVTFCLITHFDITMISAFSAERLTDIITRNKASAFQTHTCLKIFSDNE